VGHLHAGHHPVWPFVAAWAIAAVGTAVGWLMYGGAWQRLPASLASALPRTYKLMVEKFRIDELYDLVVIQPIKQLARLLWSVIDVFLIDGVLVNGAAKAAAFCGRWARLPQNGDVQRYAAFMAIAAAVILWTVLGVGGQ
jgi:NADH-quinone oxidoreductase subunit L